MFSIQEAVCRSQIEQMKKTLINLEDLLNLDKNTLFMESKGETISDVIDLWITVYALKDMVIKLIRELLLQLIVYLNKHMQFEQTISESFT